MDVKDQTKVEDQQTPEIDYQKDIHTPTLEDIFNEEAEIEDAKEVGDNPEDKKDKVEPPVVVPPVEKPVETPKVDEKPATPPIDTEKMTDNIVEKVIDKLAPTDTTPQEKKDVKDKLRDYIAKAKTEGKEVTNDEAWEFLVNETKTGLKEELKTELKDELKQEVLEDLNKEVQDEEAKEAQAAEDAKTAKETRETELNTEWDRQLTVLQTAGKIDKVLNPNDPNDRGVKQRVALFNALKEQTEAQQKAGQAVSFNLTEAFTTYYKDPMEMPAGAKAPVNGAKNSITSTTPGDFSYDEIAGSSLEDIMRNG